jgi:hypothetical protein
LGTRFAGATVTSSLGALTAKDNTLNTEDPDLVRARAEAQFKKKEKQRLEGEQAMAEYQARSQATHKKRLACEHSAWRDGRAVAQAGGLIILPGHGILRRGIGRWIAETS